MGDLDLVESDDHEGWLSELDKGIRCWLDQDIRTVRNTREADFAERDINIHALIFARICYLLRERLELAIKSCAPPSFFLFGLKFFLISISVLASAVSSFVKLHFSGLAIELNVPGLSFPNHDRCLQVNVNEDNQLMSTGLEEEMLDVAEKHINVLVAERRQITKTILVDFHFAGNPLSIKRWPQVNIRQLYRAAI